MRKLTILAAVAAIVAMGAFADSAVAQNPLQGGPGIAVAGSQQASSLPKEAKNFLNKHFKDVKVRKCEQYFAKGKYEVELANGVDIEFTTQGRVIEIDAPSRKVLATEVVKDLLPHKAYKHLNDAGMQGYVESIEFDRRGKAVEVELNIPEPDVYVYDIDGNFLVISD